MVNVSVHVGFGIPGGYRTRKLIQPLLGSPKYAYFVVLLIPFAVSIWLYGSFRFKLLSQNCERRILALSCLSVNSSGHPYWTSRLPLDGFLWNLKLENVSKKYRENSSLIITCQEWQVIYMKSCIFFIIPRWIPRRMINVSDKSCRENQNTF
jgi:hypothetical protein